MTIINFIRRFICYKNFKYNFYKINSLLLYSLVSSFNCNASDNLTTSFSANILDQTCQISISNGGQVTLPVVTNAYFTSDEKSDKYTPNDFANGKTFSINLINCPVSSDNVPDKIHFAFKPQTGQYPISTKQVFINENPSTSGGASNVGVVIFSEENKSNVLNDDGSSDVIYKVSGEGYKTNYLFDARYQNYGSVTSGSVSSHVQVSVTYE